MRVQKRIGLSSRKNMRKGGRGLRLFGYAVAAILLASVIYVVYAYTLFPIKRVDFIGNKHLTDADMKKLAGVGLGDDLLKLRCGAVAMRVLESAWVKSVSVRKEYPGRLLVRVKEAAPFALYRNGLRLFIIDDGGRKLEELKGEAVPFLPIIAANAVAVDPESFSEALSLVRALKETGISARQVEVTGVESGKKDLALNIEGTLVRVGEGQYGEKLTRFTELEGEVKKRWGSIDYIDLRFANRVVVRPLKEETVQ